MSDGKATLVLVHGAWAGSWVWQRVLPLLAERGVEARAIDLPSCGEDAQALTDLRGDEAAVREELDRVDGDVVLLGHSYGGMVITGAAAGHERVRRLVYLCAFMPAEGESLLGKFGGAVPGFWRIRDDLIVFPEFPGPPPELDVEAQALLASRRVLQPLACYTQAPAAIAWRTIPSTYVVCTNDLGLPAEFQRTMASRATETVELSTGHLPQLERPDLTADLLAALAER